jgi:hypothetical protein
MAKTASIGVSGAPIRSRVIFIVIRVVVGVVEREGTLPRGRAVLNGPHDALVQPPPGILVRIMRSNAHIVVYLMRP